ncbi:MAG: nucleotidyltransferase domain-containing protein [Candidatus Thorarchaeota archaeon]
MIFEIKGNVHPRGRVIAYLRYVPDENLEGQFRKVYDLQERESLLRSRYPKYLWWSDVYGRVLQSVDYGSIAEVLDPIQSLDVFRKMSQIPEIVEAAVFLSRQLVRGSGIPGSSLGITGSILTGTTTEASDIDLVVYGEGECRKLHGFLSRNPESIPGMERYTGNELERLVRFRWPKLEEYHNILGPIEAEKVLQGRFEGRDFYIRLVRTCDEVESEYGSKMFQYVGRDNVRCRIIDDSESIFTPCRYVVEDLSSEHKIVELVSYRGRFTEHAHAGQLVDAYGRVERVVNTYSGSYHHQVVLGENPEDYLLPRL